MPGLYLWLHGGNLYDDINKTTIDNCSDGVQWLHVLLGDCVRDAHGYASDIIGFLSILVWVFVTTPQMVKNCRHIEGVAGVSVLLIAQWTLGDTTNLIGSIMTKQLPLQTYLAVYFVFADMILFAQYLWYRRTRRMQMKQQKSENPHVPRVVLCLAASFLVFNGLFQRYLPSARPLPIIHHPGGRNLLHVEIFHNLEDEIGYAIGIISSLFYIGSRLAQLYKNYIKQSTDGLSLLMFWLAIFGNILYGLSILIRSVEPQWILEHLPWLIGSLGVVFLDISLVIQFKMYGANEFDRLSNKKLTDEEITVDTNGVINYGGHDNYGSINPDYVHDLYSTIQE